MNDVGAAPAQPGWRTSADTDGLFGRVTLLMTIATALSRVTGFGRVFALAYALSFTRLSDAYNLANTTPNIVYDLVLGGVLSATLVPVFVEWLSKRDESEAWEAISAVLTLAGLLLVGLSVVLAALAPLFIRLYTLGVHGSTAADEQAVATTLLRFFAPQVFFYGVAALVGGVLNARRRLIAPMATPILNNVVVIGVLLATPHVTRSLSLAGVRHSPGTMALLGVGTTAGVAFQALVLLPSLRAARCRVRFLWRPRHPAVRQVVCLSSWTFGSVVANQVALWAVLVLANVRAGDVSAYQAAYMFFLLPFAVVAVTVMTALLPELSTRWGAGDVAGFRAAIVSGLRAIGLWLVPAAAGYAILARPIVTVALAHGALPTASALRTADVLTLFSLGLPAFGGFLFLMSAFQAMQNTRAMFLIYCVENGVNVVLAVVLHPILGVRGLALAYALAYTVGAVCALRSLRVRIGDHLPVAKLLVRQGLAAAVMAACVAVSSSVIGGGDGLRAVLRVAGGIVVGVASYLVAGRRLGALGGCQRPAASDSAAP
jgi:putative peptidoglycan lipid II flippase